MSVCYGDINVFESYISKNTLTFSVCFGDIWKMIFRNVSQNTLRDIIDQCVKCVECVMEKFPVKERWQKKLSFFHTLFWNYNSWLANSIKSIYIWVFEIISVIHGLDCDTYWEIRMPMESFTTKSPNHSFKKLFRKI